MQVEDIVLNTLLWNLADIQVKQIHVAMVTGSKVLVCFHIQLIEPAPPILGNVLGVERSIRFKTPVKLREL